MLLTLYEVQLGYFEYVQKRINGIVSGSPLSITTDKEIGNAAGERILKFSKDFSKKLDSLQQYNCYHHLSEEKLSWKLEDLKL